MNRNLGDLFLDNYETYFRQPVESRVFRAEGMTTIQILAYDKVFRGCRVFASLGLSHFSEQIGEAAEIYMPVDAGWDMIPRILFDALLLGLVGQEMQIGVGISLPGIEDLNEQFAAKYNKHAVYLTSPYGLPTQFQEIRGENAIGKMYLAMFLSKKEHEYFCDRGSNNLEQVFQDRRVDPYHLARKSCID